MELFNVLCMLIVIILIVVVITINQKGTPQEQTYKRMVDELDVQIQTLKNDSETGRLSIKECLLFLYRYNEREESGNPYHTKKKADGTVEYMFSYEYPFYYPRSTKAELIKDVCIKFLTTDHETQNTNEVIDALEKPGRDTASYIVDIQLFLIITCSKALGNKRAAEILKGIIWPQQYFEMRNYLRLMLKDDLNSQQYLYNFSNQKSIKDAFSLHTLTSLGFSQARARLVPLIRELVDEDKKNLRELTKLPPTYFDVSNYFDDLISCLEITTSISSADKYVLLGILRLIRYWIANNYLSNSQLQRILNYKNKEVILDERVIGDVEGGEVYEKLWTLEEFLTDKNPYQKIYNAEGLLYNA